MTNWPTKKLGEICEERKEKNIKNLDLPVYTVSNIFGFILSEEFFYKRVYSENLENYKLVYKNDFAYNPSAVSIGSLGLFKEEKPGLISPMYVVFYIKEKNTLNPYFLFYLLKTNLYLNKIKNLAASHGSIRQNLKLEDLFNFEIPIPNLPIQQKIVKILDTIQSAVEIQEKIIENTKELKKNLMNLLFHYGIKALSIKELASLRVGELTSSEIEKLGLRLKKTEIGEIPEDWEVVRLGEVVKEMINGFPTGERDENGILQLRMDSITSDGKINLEAGVKVPKRIGIENYFLQKGDILFNNTNSIDLVGKTALFRGEFKECVFSNHLTRIRVDLNKTLPEWIFYILFRNWELKLFKNLATRRVGQADINRNVLKNLKIPLPFLSEQQEIVEILKTIDQKIEIEKKKKELYEELFRTMLNKIMSQQIDINLLDY
jgi:type I restriction enzyme S subunit